MITPYELVEKDKELRLIGYMELQPPFSELSFDEHYFEGRPTPITNIDIIKGKTKILTRQSPNRDIISSDPDRNIRQMMAEVTYSTLYELRKTNIESPVILLFTYRRQLWDWEIICQAYA